MISIDHLSQRLIQAYLDTQEKTSIMIPENNPIPTPNKITLNIFDLGLKSSGLSSLPFAVSCKEFFLNK